MENGGKEGEVPVEEAVAIGGKKKKRVLWMSCVQSDC